jgi:hypothetical protein
MRTQGFFSVLLISAGAIFGQAPAPDNAPQAVDDALRARVGKFYDAFGAGKFKEAYLLVDDESQDKFFEVTKSRYKTCKITKIDYKESFTSAEVSSSCMAEWQWHGLVSQSALPVISNWKIVDGQWFWHFVKPAVIPTPFSSTGFEPAPPEAPAGKTQALPRDFGAMARDILAKVGIDKTSVHLLVTQPSEDAVRLRNDLPGEITLALDRLEVPGLKITVGKTRLGAHEETAILFKWDPAERATLFNPSRALQVHVDPTGQVFKIDIVLENPPRPAPGAAQPQPAQPQPTPPQK